MKKKNAEKINRRVSKTSSGKTVLPSKYAICRKRSRFVKNKKQVEF